MITDKDISELTEMVLNDRPCKGKCWVCGCDSTEMICSECDRTLLENGI